MDEMKHTVKTKYFSLLSGTIKNHNTPNLQWLNLGICLWNHNNNWFQNNYLQNHEPYNKRIAIKDLKLFPQLFTDKNIFPHKTEDREELPGNKPFWTFINTNIFRMGNSL